MSLKHFELLKNLLLNITQQALKQVEKNPKDTQRIEQEHEMLYKAIGNFERLANDVADVMKMTMTENEPNEDELVLFNEKSEKLYQLTQEILREREEAKPNGIL